MANPLLYEMNQRPDCFSYFIGSQHQSSGITITTKLFT